MSVLKAGSAITDVTPQKPMFLHGYPHVERISEGVHDPLYASAMVIDNGEIQIGFCAVDVLYISKEITEKVREGVVKATGIPQHNLMISATHTHSGPITFSDIFYDPVVPKADPEYISYLVDKLIEVFMNAYNNMRVCKIAITTADGTGVGGNRRNKTDAIDPEIPIIVLKETETDRIFALSVVYCMHPTVLHEDSRLYSADFPGYTREYINRKFGDEVTFLYHTGPSGNQSPRHYVQSNTFSEAQRLGYILGERITNSVKQLTEYDFKNWVPLDIQFDDIILPKKEFVSVERAEIKLQKAKQKLDTMRQTNPHSPGTRTAEVDWFGAEEYRQLAEMAANGELDKVYATILPVEISIVVIDNSNFIFLPGELFVEYSLTIKEKLQNTYVISLSNGVLAGYLVTAEAENEGGYEVLNSIFPANAGEELVKKVLTLVKKRL